MENIFSKIKELLLQVDKKRIIFPEFNDERIIRAANRLAEENLLIPIYIGSKQAVEEVASQFNIQLASYEVIDPNTFAEFEQLVNTYLERRKNKQIDRQVALEIVKEINYFSTLLVYLNYAGGLVSGAINTTSSALRPLLEIVKTKEGIKKVSGSYLMVRDHEQYIFADCAVNIAPSSEDLAEITLLTVRTAQLLKMEPKVALLSFSTKGSSQSKETEKVMEAYKLVKEKAPSLLIDGELQFDAAYIPAIAEKKAPQSVIKGDANIFIFPNLDAGNIGCKIVERLGGFQAVGPLLQGLNRPVNLLSRGCNEEDVYNVALMTALQANENNLL